MKPNARALPVIGTDAGRTAGDAFHRGAEFYAYRYFGVHRERDGIVFRVWAPGADSVSLCGDFCDWDTARLPMKSVGGGVWELDLPDGTVRDGQNYKYFLRRGERSFFKADPFGTRMQNPPETASVISLKSAHVWRDAGWMEYRRGKFDREHAVRQPVNVYEICPDSWKKRADGKQMNYRELASELIPYVKQMGYTHVLMTPVAEYADDASAGYRVCGFYAPTSRYGTPDDLRELVDMMHEAGLGVIFTWVPAFFPKDEHGLYEFDGEQLYGYRQAERAEIPGSGVVSFDLGRPEVRSFLFSNAVYWAEEFHADGLFVDAVSQMLYLDYGRKPGEWTPGAAGDNRNADAVTFFRELHLRLARDYPDVVTVADEETAWPRVTDLSGDGLGFTFKRNAGWTADTLSYMREEPSRRRDLHQKISFYPGHTADERFFLSVPHGEVSGGRRSLSDRMPGDSAQKFAGLRAFLAYMILHPGKKLLFTGCEFGQFSEWVSGRETEWLLLAFEAHRRAQYFTASLNRFYLSEPALWEREDSPDTLVFIDRDDAEESVLSFRRVGRDGNELTVLFHFLPTAREDFLLSVPEGGVYREVFNTDRREFGGTGCENPGDLAAVPDRRESGSYAVRIRIPPTGAVVLRRVTDAGKPKKRTIHSTTHTLTGR